MSLHGGINLNVTGSLVIALIGRLYRSGAISKEFANQVFDDAQTIQLGIGRPAGVIGGGRDKPTADVLKDAPAHGRIRYWGRDSSGGELPRGVWLGSVGGGESSRGRGSELGGRRG
jgi:hypothetical protein